MLAPVDVNSSDDSATEKVDNSQMEMDDAANNIVDDSAIEKVDNSQIEMDDAANNIVDDSGTEKVDNSQIEMDDAAVNNDSGTENVDNSQMKMDDAAVSSSIVPDVDDSATEKVDNSQKEIDDATVNSIIPETTLKKYHMVSTILEVNHIIKTYEKETFSTFVSDKTDKGFNNNDWQVKSRFKWKTKGCPLMDPDIPAMYLGAKLLTCQFGKDRNLNIKRKWKEKQQRKREENQGVVRTHNRTQQSKKVDCPASIWIKKMATFPEYKVSCTGKSRCKSKEFAKKKATQRFWQDKMNDMKSVQVVMQYLIQLPDPDIHKNHPVGEGTDVKEKPVKEIVQCIESLAARKICKVSTISKHLDEFRRNILFKNKEMPASTRRAYFPDHKDIHNILYRYKRRNRSSPSELQQLEVLIQNWSIANPDDQFYYRRKVKCSENTSFLLCYQSKQQKRLLNLYGDLVVLDAAYQTIDYEVPLYFLCVQTNVAYQIVGMFIVHKGIEQSIAEALAMFQTWNPDWNAKYFLLDFGQNEEISVKNVFPDCTVYLTDFHLERRWEAWAKCSSNGIEKHREMMVSTLRKIADASTTIDYLAAVAGLTDSELWKSSVKLQEWINSIWLPSSQKWVKAFKPSEMVFHVHNSNGLEMMNELLPFTYIKGFRDSAVSVMVGELITNYLPMIYQRYEQRNLEGIDGYLSTPRNIPEPVMNTPEFVVNTYISMSEKAASNSTVQVQKTVERTFIVTNAGTINTVFFGDSEKLPFCYTCSTWERIRQPCEHFHAVFQSQHPDWGWEQLCAQFRNYPCLVLDHGIFPSVVITQVDDLPQEASEAAYFVTCDSTNNEVSSGEEPCDEMDQSSSLAEQCRQCLTEITDITFSLDDHSTLQNLLTTLRQTKGAVKHGISPS